MTPYQFEAARQLLVAHDGKEPAEEMLYARWYHTTEERTRDYPGPAAYLAAILDPVRFEAGWNVARTSLPGRAGCIEIVREGQRRIAAPPLVAPSETDALIFERGTEVLAFQFVAEYAGGFWHVTSPAWEAQGQPERLQRLYFNVMPDAECAFARVFTAKADPEVPWSMKLLSGRSAIGRCDSAVAYLPVDLGLDIVWISDLLAALGQFVAGKGPPGSRLLAPGIAWAPDLETGRSFGQILCAALADTPANPADSNAWTAAARVSVASILELGP